MDFDKKATDVLISYFVSGEAIMEMERCNFIFDFHQIIVIDLECWNDAAHAWMDVNGKDFYAEVFIDGSENLDKNEVNVD